MTTNERLREELKKVTAERDSLKEMLGALASLDAFQKFAKRIPITAPGIPPVPSECKCLIVKNEDNQDEIYFCTIHTAAPKILEALANGNLSSAIERAVKAELDRFMKDLLGSIAITVNATPQIVGCAKVTTIQARCTPVRCAVTSSATRVFILSTLEYADHSRLVSIQSNELIEEKRHER